MVNPIIDWSDTDIWAYASAEKIEMNPLYCEGFRRVGCVGCPMAGTAMRKMEFARYPKIKAAYIRAFERMLERRRERGLSCDWQTRCRCLPLVDGGRGDDIADGDERV